MIAVITQQQENKDFRLRRKISRANRKVRDRRENSMRRELRSEFYTRLEKTIISRVVKIGKTAMVVEELFRPSQFQDAFTKVFLPQINRALFTGIQFEADFIRTMNPEQSFRGGFVIEQIKGPESPPSPDDIELPPGIRVELSRTMKRKIAEFLKERSVGVWNKVGPTIRKKLEREILRTVEEGEPFKVLEKRLRKLLKNVKRIQPAAIARTEVTYSMNKGGQFERDELGISSKEWVSTIDSANRGADPTSPFDHLSPDGQTVSNDGVFVVSGESIPNPGDGSAGASAGNLINCFLPGTNISGRVNAATKSFYKGKAVEIIMGGGMVLRVTDKHPILSKNGFVTAGSLQQGDQLISYIGNVNEPVGDSSFVSTTFESNDDDEPSSIEEIFRAFSLFGFVERRRATTHDFYRDGEFIDGNIQVVWPNWELLMDFESGCLNNGRYLGFKLKNPRFSFAVSDCSLGLLSGRDFTTSSCIPSSRALTLDGFPVPFHFRPFDSFLFGLGSRLDTCLYEFPTDLATLNSIRSGNIYDSATSLVEGYPFSNYGFWEDSLLCRNSDGVCFEEPVTDIGISKSEFCRSLLNAQPGLVGFDDVLSVHPFDYSGGVYDVQSPLGWIIANGVVCCNCRCASIASLKDVRSSRGSIT